MHETEETLKRFFARHPDPWRDADFAAVTDREFEIEAEMDTQEAIHSSEFVASP